MNNCQIKPRCAGVVFFIASAISQAAVPSHAGLPGSKVRQAQPSAPMVMCTVTMNQWCMVQADAKLNMSDQGDYRIWKISAPVGKQDLVTIRESKNCDSSADTHPARKFEKDEQSAPEEHRRTVEFALTSDGACTLKVEYIVGDTELARESTQVAMYRIYLCNGKSCVRPILSIN